MKLTKQQWLESAWKWNDFPDHAGFAPGVLDETWCSGVEAVQTLPSDVNDTWLMLAQFCLEKAGIA